MTDPLQVAAAAALDYMRRVEDTLIHDMTAAVKLSYERYLDHEGLMDHTSGRIGYFEILSQIVMANPFPIDRVQHAVEDYIDKQRMYAEEHLTGQVQQLFKQAIKDTKTN